MKLIKILAFTSFVILGLIFLSQTNKSYAQYCTEGAFSYSQCGANLCHTRIRYCEHANCTTYQCGYEFDVNCNCTGSCTFPTTNCYTCSGGACYQWCTNACATTCNTCGGNPTPTPGGNPTPTPTPGGNPTPTPITCPRGFSSCNRCLVGVCTAFCSPTACDPTACDLCGGGSTPTPTPTPTPVPCQVTTNPASLTMSSGQTSAVTATVTSGLGIATITRMTFGSYNTSVATVNPAIDSASPYSTVVTGVNAGATAIWATATLSDGRSCPSAGTTDTNITVAALQSCQLCLANNTCFSYSAADCGANTNCTLCTGGTPTPTPTSTPTPTPAPSIYSISGNVFVDTNENGIKDTSPVAETNYTGGITITSTGGTVKANSIDGTFIIGDLPAGTYTVSYTNKPTDYKVTFPTNNTPPSFEVTVGAGCSVIPNSGNCDATDNVTDLNFGISNNAAPWVQIIGSDIRADNGFDAGGAVGGGGGGGGGTSTFTNPVPLSATTVAQCGNGNTMVSGTGNSTPGLIISTTGEPSFGEVSTASETDWTVSSQSYNPIRKGGVIKSSYSYMLSVANQAGVTLKSIDPYCAGILTDCKLSTTIPHDIYLTDGDLTLTGNSSGGNSITFGGNQNYIILVKGNLTIKTPIYVEKGSTLLFSVHGNIYVDPSVGAAVNDYYSSTPNLEGIYSTDQSFIIQGSAVCPLSPDRKLNVAGAIIVNASLTGGTFQNERNLCAGNAYCPVFTITARPDFILNAPTFVKKSNDIWQEVAP